VLLHDQLDGRPVRLSQLQNVIGVTSGTRVARVADVQDACGLLVDDPLPTIEVWIAHKCVALPVGFPAEVRARSLML
jgi:hypothetical protein